MGGGSGNVNTGVSSPSVVTPANAKRSGQKPSSRPPSSAGANSGESSCVFARIGSLYAVVGFEGRIDAALARKKVDIQESVKNPTRVQRTLRIYVYNTFANQTQTGDRNENNEPPSWSLKIIGRILQNGSDSDTTLVLRNPDYKPEVLIVFKKITIYLDQNQYPENHVILWESSRALTLNEGFEVKRKGDKEFTAIIRFEMNYVPEKFKLSPLLSEILGLEIETRSRINFRNMAICES
ncbi:hypothetical protein HanRHA438_Chr02g0051471 [Helianthus annuus]|nr:hypothetical protein HanRHA438_Chr02g0051471 [Helianthus annuus]